MLFIKKGCSEGERRGKCSRQRRNACVKPGGENERPSKK